MYLCLGKQCEYKKEGLMGFLKKFSWYQCGLCFQNTKRKLLLRRVLSFKMWSYLVVGEGHSEASEIFHMGVCVWKSAGDDREGFNILRGADCSGLDGWRQASHLLLQAEYFSCSCCKMEFWVGRDLLSILEHWAELWLYARQLPHYSLFLAALA